MGTTKTTVYLDSSDYRRLKALARERHQTAAELVREAVAEYTRRHASTRQPTSLGAGRSGRGNLSDQVEALLGGMVESR